MLSENKYKIVYYYSAGAFALLLFVKFLASDFFKAIVDFALTFLPFIILIGVVISAIVKYEKNPELKNAIRKKALLEALYLLIITLLFYILYSPKSFLPILESFKKFGKLFSLENYFIILAYICVAVISFSLLIFFIRVYQKSKGTYAGSIHGLFRKNLYSVFFIFSFLFLSSFVTYPQAYSPLTDFFSNIFYVFISGGNSGSNPDSAANGQRIASVKSALADTYQNLKESISGSNEELSIAVAETKETLDNAISRTNKDLKKTLSQDIEDRLDVTGGTLAGDLIVEDDLAVEGTTYLTDTIPDADDSYDLGSVSKGWDNAYVHSLHGSSILTIGDGSTSHSISDSDDLLVSGELEVNGKSYLDGEAIFADVSTFAGAATFAGAVTFDGAIDIGGGLVSNSGEPVSAADLATKNYVDVNMASAGVLQRTGTTLSPVNSGDALDMGSGSITGGALTLSGVINAASSSAQTIGSIAITGDNISGLPATPAGDTSAASKAYVDAQIAIAGYQSGSGTNLDMANTGLILNIGNSGTDFTSSGGLNLAGALAAGSGSEHTLGSVKINGGALSSVTTIATSGAINGVVASGGTISTGVWEGTDIEYNYLDTTVMVAGENISLLNNNSNFIADGNTNWSNDYGFITDGNTGWNNEYSLITAATADTLINKTWNGNVIGVAYGGTGLSSYAVGDLIIASGATTLARLPDVAVGSVLVSGGVGVAPSWGALSSIDHGSFSGLTDDDHTQYAFLNGRSLSQTLIGSTGAGNNLTLVGGTQADSDLILKTTSGTAGSSADMLFQTGVNGGITAMNIDESGIVYVNALQSGAQSFETDAGVVQWADLPVNAAATGTVESYAAMIDGNALLTVSALSASNGAAISGAYVGIGTSTTGANLRVSNGWLCVDNNDSCSAGSTAGTVYAVGSYTTGADYAEYFYTNDTDLQSGEAVCIDAAKENAVKRCKNSGDNEIMGIVSSTPSIVGNNQDGFADDSHYKIIGMLGQVSGKVMNENGKIAIGDSLTAAGKAGYMRKADAGESTVGVALQNFDGKDGNIQVLIARRNKSLTVEKVEEEVTARIAEMDVEDQVNEIVAAAKADLEKNSNTKFAGYDAQISSISSQLTTNNQQLTTLESVVAALQTDITELQDEIDGKIALGVDDYMQNTLGIVSEDGVVKIANDVDVAGEVSATSLRAEEKVSAEKAAVQALEMKNEKGDVYCVRIVGEKLEETKGNCDEAAEDVVEDGVEEEELGEEPVDVPPAPAPAAQTGQVSDPATVLPGIVETN